MVDRDSREYGIAYDAMTIGMMLAHMSNVGEIDIDYMTYGDDELTDFAMEVSEAWEKNDDEYDCWDWFVEDAILKKFKKGE